MSGNPSLSLVRACMGRASRVACAERVATRRPENDILFARPRQLGTYGRRSTASDGIHLGRPDPTSRTRSTTRIRSFHGPGPKTSHTGTFSQTLHKFSERTRAGHQDTEDAQLLPTQGTMLQRLRLTFAESVTIEKKRIWGSLEQHPEPRPAGIQY